MTATGTRRDGPPPTDTGSGGDGGSGGTYERITVGLTRKASDALAAASARMDQNRTDTVNKAALLYDLLTKLQAKPGGIIYIRDGDGAELERLRLL